MRKMLGGGMRQAGFLAAAGLYALDHHVERLEEDHRRARRLYEGLTAAGFSAVRPQTNMVYVTVNQANDTVSSLAEAGVLVVPVDTDTIRLVTHLDVDDSGINEAVEALASIAGSQS
jgi:threonine aldolase